MPSVPIRSLLLAAAASAALAAGSVSVLAADKQEGRTATAAEEKSGAAATQGGQGLAYRVRASEIMDKTVKNAQGETLGTIEDLVVGRKDEVAYAIVSVGGFLGLGDRLVAVPYAELRRSGPDTFVYDVTREQLKARPAFQFSAADSGAGDDSADAYRERVGEEVDQWKGKVESFSSDARQKGTESGKAAADEVDDAWDRVKSEWNKLQGASGDTWQKTKAAFERAWDDFQEAWRSATNS